MPPKASKSRKKLPTLPTATHKIMRNVKGKADVRFYIGMFYSLSINFELITLFRGCRVYRLHGSQRSQRTTAATLRHQMVWLWREPEYVSFMSFSML